MNLKNVKLNDRAFLSILSDMPIQTTMTYEHIESFWQNVIDKKAEIVINVKVHPSKIEKVTNLYSIRNLIFNNKAKLEEKSAICLRILFGLVTDTYPIPYIESNSKIANKLYSKLSNSQRRFFQNLEIQFNIIMDENFTNTVQTNYYTDGSYYNKKKTIGSAFLVKRAKSKRNELTYVFGGMLNKKYSLSGSLIAEVNAIKEAIKDALKHRYTDIAIHTDSMVCISYMNNTFESKNRYLRELKEYIMGLQGKLKVTFLKVKGHSIVKENNLVDEYAKSFNKENSLSTKKYRMDATMDEKTVIVIYESFDSEINDYLHKTIYIPDETDDLDVVLRKLNQEYMMRHYGQKMLNSNRQLINKFEIKFEKFGDARKWNNCYVVSMYDKLYELIY